eukprot:15431865-Alexandrium_andersonii.AAC.1
MLIPSCEIMKKEHWTDSDKRWAEICARSLRRGGAVYRLTRGKFRSERGDEPLPEDESSGK